MNKLKLYVLFSIMLIIGLIVGCGNAARSGQSADVQINNANLQVGDEAPDFRLPDHTGGYVRLSDYRGQWNVVIAFYPSAWTPV